LSMVNNVKTLGERQPLIGNMLEDKYVYMLR
jgi:hypothetical protein